MPSYRYEDSVRKVFARAVEEAHRRNQAYVDPTHITMGLLGCEDPELASLLDLLGVPPDRLERALSGSLPPSSAAERAPDELPWTSISKRVLQEAVVAARSFDSHGVTPVHVLLGVMKTERHPAAKILAEFGVTLERAREAHRQLRTGEPDRAALPAARAGAGADPAPVWFVEVDPGSAEPLYEQIVEAVEEAVATGKMAEGERLPSVRDLAGELGIAPGTVARAYSRLEERGVLSTEGARGTRVAERHGSPRPDDLVETLEGLLRPVAVAAYHMGARAQEVRNALEAAMRGIYRELEEPPAA